MIMENSLDKIVKLNDVICDDRINQFPQQQFMSKLLALSEKNIFGLDFRLKCEKQAEKSLL